MLKATASLTHFAKPEWEAKATGSLELPQIKVLTGAEGLNAGTVELEVNGHSCKTTPAVAQKHSRFWQRTHPQTGDEAET